MDCGRLLNIYIITAKLMLLKKFFAKTSMSYMLLGGEGRVTKQSSLGSWGWGVTCGTGSSMCATYPGPDRVGC
jgi:hypothetical protein